jgi:adenylate cyclase
MAAGASQASRIFDLPLREQLAAGQVVLASSLVFDARGQGQILWPPPDYWGALPGKLDDVGLINFYNDADGVVRQFIAALRDDAGESGAAFAALLAERLAPLPPLEEPFPRYVGYAGPPGTFPRISFNRLLSPAAASDPEVQKVRGKVAIIGSEVAGSQDIVLTPYARSLLAYPSQMMSGVEMHANIAETLLTGRFPRAAPLAWRLLALAAAGLLATGAFLRLSPFMGLAVLFSFCGLAVLLSFLCFLGGWVLPVTAGQLAMGLSYLGTLGWRLTGEERARVRLRRLFGRYVADPVVEQLVQSGKEPDLGGEARQVTVLFLDIHRFTAMSERLHPHEVMELLNTFFSRVCEPVWQEGGTVDKFMGDAVMAVFGSPLDLPDHARRALAAALGMAQVVREFDVWMGRRFPKRGLPRFSAGIGLHTGEAVVGNLGSPRHMDFTAIGDTVNTAARLEGVSKDLAWTIAASQATVEAAGPGVITGRSQEVQIKGRESPVSVFEVLGLGENGL